MQFKKKKNLERLKREQKNIVIFLCKFQLMTVLLTFRLNFRTLGSMLFRLEYILPVALLMKGQ